MQQHTISFFFAVLIAICITSTMDANGYGAFSAFILIPLSAVFIWLGKHSRAELGVVVGKKSQYGFSVLIPILGVSLIAGAALLTGHTDTTETDWNRTWFNVSLASSVGILVVLLTEEGFFRELLWSLTMRTGHSEKFALWATTAAFVAWHLSAVFLTEECAPPAVQVPIYLVSATLLGLIWGLMRQLSGSVWPASIYRAIWNGLVYELYGFGERVGDLGISATWLYGPELGLAGLVVNGAVFYYLYEQSKKVGAVTQVDESRTEEIELNTATSQ
ncbi:MAG TPA: hypothetical protein DCR00_05065 [Gammaproteobacteria bacterium]|nr:hypothetical protein [Gammaproteobacteria bacterium]